MCSTSVSQILMAYESPRDLVKRQVRFWLVGLGQRLRICILFKVPDDVDQSVYSLHFEKQDGRLYYSPKCVAHLWNG